MLSILVPLEDSDDLPSILTTALRLAQRHGSYVEGICLRQNMADVMIYAGIAGSPIDTEEMAREDRDRIARARRRFEAAAADHGLPLDDRGGTAGQPTAFFKTDTPAGDDFFGRYARIFDVTVLGQPDRRGMILRTATLETALFDGGRAVLLAPPMAPETLGETVVIAWNGSTETARAVALARPFLAAAKRRIVLTVEGGMVPGPDGEAAARSLARVGLEAEMRHVPQGHGTGPTILAECRALGADLLIKGAYTTSRLRQMIFGGATSHIIEMAHLPVFLAH